MSITFSAADFEFVTKLLKTHSAVSLEQGKEYLVQARLEPVARELGLASVQALIQILRSAESNSALTRQVVEALVTHETSFFRDSEPFEALRLEIIPRLIELRQSSRALTIWSAAASSGQEPYSVAMLIREYFPQLLNWELNILASDLSEAILSRAAEGRYLEMEINRGLPPYFSEKYFRLDGRYWLIKPEIRNMVHFFRQNLLASFDNLPQLDIVLLRNVLIYFDVPTKRTVLENVRRILKPDGILLLGGSETTVNIHDKFQAVPFEETLYYRKLS